MVFAPDTLLPYDPDEFNGVLAPEPPVEFTVFDAPEMVAAADPAVISSEADDDVELAAGVAEGDTVPPPF